MQTFGGQTKGIMVFLVVPNCFVAIVVSLGSLALRRCYTVKCFVQLVSQCFGDIVAEQVAQNISQCNILCNCQNRCETSCKSRCRK